MKIVIASAFPEKLIPTIKRFDDFYFFLDDTKSPLSAKFIELEKIDLVLSFGYGRIFTKSAINKTRIINLHGGLLPWNKGPNPNLWSWIDNTPKGVTIHEVDAGVDTGRIIVQRKLRMRAGRETLQTSFDKIVMALVELFDKYWPRIRAGKYEPKEQVRVGTSHTFRDQRPFQSILENNLNIKIPELLKLIEPHVAGSRNRSKRAAFIARRRRGQT